MLLPDNSAARKSSLSHLGQWACWYAEALGWNVISLTWDTPRPHPRVKGWTAYRTDPLPVEGLITEWAFFPKANIGVIVGAPSRLVIADFDPRNGNALDQYGSQLPPGPRVRTPRGGLHCYFFHPFTDTMLEQSVSKLAPGLDLLSGGLAVPAPPSTRLDAAYRWEPGFEIGRVPLPTIPWFLPYLMRLYRARKRQADRRFGQLTPEQRAKLPRVLDDVLPFLDNVTPMGRGWEASCPVPQHGRRRGDLDRSMSVGVAADGKLLAKCFAGCFFADILIAIAQRRQVALPLRDESEGTSS